MKKTILLIILLINSVFCFSISPISIDTNDGNEVILQRKPHERGPYTGHGRRFTLGVAFGIGMDWLNPQADDLVRNGTVFGIKYGIPIDINFTDKDNYYFSFGLFFNHTGGKLKFQTIFENDNTQEVTTERKFNTSYITIPTGIKLKTPSMKNFVIATHFGLYHSFRLSSRASDQYIANDGPQELKKYVYTKETALFREAAYIGLGVEYIIKEDFRAYFYAIYSHSFLNYFNPTQSHLLASGDKEKATLANLEFQFGLSF